MFLFCLCLQHRSYTETVIKRQIEKFKLNRSISFHKSNNFIKNVSKLA
jgi:hypothetical protein